MYHPNPDLDNPGSGFSGNPDQPVLFINGFSCPFLKITSGYYTSTESFWGTRSQFFIRNQIPDYPDPDYPKIWFNYSRLLRLQLLVIIRQRNAVFKLVQKNLIMNRILDYPDLEMRFNRFNFSRLICRTHRKLQFTPCDPNSIINTSLFMNLPPKMPQKAINDKKLLFRRKTSKINAPQTWISQPIWHIKSCQSHPELEIWCLACWDYDPTIKYATRSPKHAKWCHFAQNCSISRSKTVKSRATGPENENGRKFCKFGEKF